LPIFDPYLQPWKHAGQDPKKLLMKKQTIVMAGDVGGTKTLLALYEIRDGHPIQRVSRKFNSREYTHFGDLVSDFLTENPDNPEIAVFGIPGPVRDGVVKSTNLPWVISEMELSRQLNIPQIVLLNDLEAAAHAIPDLPEQDFDILLSGQRSDDPQRYVVIAPGTGLGQAFLFSDKGRFKVIASEGGHAGFSPANPLESELYRFLHQKFGYVSNERIISGSGLPNVFDFLVDDQGMPPREETLVQMEVRDRAIVISEHGISGLDPVCKKAMEIFVSVLGSHARNLALSFIPDGGIFLGGGIPYKIAGKLSDGSFERAFLNAGRMEGLVRSIPVFVINNNRTALHGAAGFALNRLKENSIPD
jgi:glucokinase